MSILDGKDLAIDGAYWVLPGKLLAGPYPGDRLGARTRRRLRRLLRAGVTSFLDLTEAGEYGVQPYAAFLHKEAAAIEHSIGHKHPIAYQRAPIPDMGTPSVDEMAHILDALDAALEAGHTVYLHCLGGIGRTGTVVGCHLARHGMSGKDALAKIDRLRGDVSERWGHSPETTVQIERVLAYSGETLHRWPGGPGERRRRRARADCTHRD